jgi:sec-independent protein translocase protein TatC
MQMPDIAQSFKSHFCELRNRLLIVASCFAIAFAGCYYFSGNLQRLFIAPLQPILSQGRELVYTNLPEAFFSEINIAFFASLLLIFPVLLSQIWLFLRPGLFATEKSVLRNVMLAIPLLFYLGVTFAQALVLPRAFNFFISFEHKNIPLYFLPKLSDYLNFTQKLMFVFGLGFELPVVLFALTRLNLVSLQDLKSRWRLVVLIICLVSAIITPPDALSMIALALPMIALYGLTLLVIQWNQPINLASDRYA